MLAQILSMGRKRTANRLGYTSAARRVGLQQLRRHRYRARPQRKRNFGGPACFPLLGFECPNIGEHQGLERDHLALINLTTNRQTKRLRHRPTIARQRRCTTTIPGSPDHGRPSQLTPFHRRRLGLDLQLRFHHPPRRQKGHRRSC